MANTRTDPVEYYFGLINRLKEELGADIFKRMPSLFLEVCADLGLNKLKEEGFESSIQAYTREIPEIIKDAGGMTTRGLITEKLVVKYPSICYREISRALTFLNQKKIIFFVGKATGKASLWKLRNYSTNSISS